MRAYELLWQDEHEHLTAYAFISNGLKWSNGQMVTNGLKVLLSCLLYGLNTA